MVSIKKRLPRQWGMPLLSIATVMLLSACAIAPGGKIPYETEVEPLQGAVKVEPITIDLVKAMRPTTRPGVASLTALGEDTPSVPTAYDYRIGRGDILNVIVYEHPELTIPAGSMRSAEESGNVVHSDGTIFYPYVGKIKVAGRTVKDVRSEIQRRLSGYIAEPQVDVKVAAFNAQKVYVTGQVTAPGVFPVTNVPLRVLDVLSEAGGLSETANWHDVILSRDGSDMHVSVFDMLSNGDIAENVQLRDGDVIHVPDIGNQQIYVMGEVNKPAAFPMANGRFSLTNAIARAGGIREVSADASGIFVIRGNPDTSDTYATVYQLNANNAAALVLGTQFMLQPADVVYVTAAPVSLWNRVLNQILPSLTTLYQATEIQNNLQ